MPMTAERGNNATPPAHQHSRDGLLATHGKVCDVIPSGVGGRTQGKVRCGKQRAGLPAARCSQGRAGGRANRRHSSPRTISSPPISGCCPGWGSCRAGCRGPARLPCAARRRALRQVAGRAGLVWSRLDRRLGWRARCQRSEPPAGIPEWQGMQQRLSHPASRAAACCASPASPLRGRTARPSIAQSL